MRHHLCRCQGLRWKNPPLLGEQVHDGEDVPVARASYVFHGVDLWSSDLAMVHLPSLPFTGDTDTTFVGLLWKRPVVSTMLTFDLLRSQAQGLGETGCCQVFLKKNPQLPCRAVAIHIVQSLYHGGEHLTRGERQVVFGEIVAVTNVRELQSYSALQFLPLGSQLRCDATREQVL